ncbi:hypothetical protein [Mesorhizobium sp. KR1-2]|uniref:hypothetical protein n=1 Tax=Mesorhizobium sp. KR1-2 TaxID=3156609 RepID=UPI0032B382B5
MSADDRVAKVKKPSQPLVPAPMPEYEYQRSFESDYPSYGYNPTEKGERKLDLSGVVLNLS